MVLFGDVGSGLWGRGRGGEVATPSSSFLDQVYLSSRCVAEFWLLANNEEHVQRGILRVGGLLSVCMRYVKAY